VLLTAEVVQAEMVQGRGCYEVATALSFLVCWTIASENIRVVKAVGGVLSFGCTVLR